MPTPEQAKLVERFCVVCGLGSHRLDWADSSAPACDSHSEAEVRSAVAKRRSVGGGKVEESKQSKTPDRAAAASE